MMSTGALAFTSHNNSNNSKPASTSTSTSTSTTLTRKAQTQAQQNPSLSSSRGKRSGSTTTSKNTSSSLSFSPTDIGGVATLLSLKFEGVKHIANPAQVLSDASYVVMDPTKFFPGIKISKLRMQYAQVFGRLMILGTTFLPHHGVHPEEMAVQLFLLSTSMKPIIRSTKLYQCIAASKSSESNCVEECKLEIEDLEASLDVENVWRIEEPLR